MAVELSLHGGGSAIVLETNGHHVAVHATRSFPPGSTLEGHAADGSGQYQIKVRSSRRLGDADSRLFRVDGRFVNISRTQREHLLRGTTTT